MKKISYLSLILLLATSFTISACSPKSKTLSDQANLVISSSSLDWPDLYPPDPCAPEYIPPDINICLHNQGNKTATSPEKAFFKLPALIIPVYFENLMDFLPGGDWQLPEWITINSFPGFPGSTEGILISANVPGIHGANQAMGFVSIELPSDEDTKQGIGILFLNDPAEDGWSEGILVPFGILEVDDDTQVMGIVFVAKPGTNGYATKSELTISQSPMNGSSKGIIIQNMPGEDGSNEGIIIQNMPGWDGSNEGIIIQNMPGENGSSEGIIIQNMPGEDGSSKGIIIQNMPGEDGSSKGIIIQNMPGEDGSSKGIIIQNMPGEDGSSKGIIIQNMPGEDGSNKGIIIQNYPTSFNGTPGIMWGGIALGDLPLGFDFGEGMMPMMGEGGFGSEPYIFGSFQLEKFDFPAELDPDESSCMSVTLSFTEVTISKQMDMASTDLAQFAINGNSCGTAEIDFVSLGTHLSDGPSVSIKKIFQIPPPPYTYCTPQIATIPPALPADDQPCDFDCSCEPDQGETAHNCPKDCGETCGNGVCGCGETQKNCKRDCSALPDDTGSYCGDGVCNRSENRVTCPQDC